MKKLAFFIYFLTLLACKEKVSPSESDVFDSPTDLGLLENKSIKEASGLIASVKNSGYLWTHNDSGDTNRIFLIDQNGKGTREFYLEGATNRDWEAISMASFTEGSFLYIADIGDNDAKYENCFIYKVAEPLVGSSTPQTNVLSNVQKITFKYPDGARDAESLMIDQATKDIYILSKRESNQRLYRLPYPQSFSEVITAEFVETVDFSNATNASLYLTDGSISGDNQEILIRNYFQVFHWRRGSNESVAETLKRSPNTYSYSVEPQGEGICFSSNQKSFFTISEEGSLKVPVRLYQSTKK